MPGVTCGCGQQVKVTLLNQKEVQVEFTSRNLKGCAEARRLREEGKDPGSNFECSRMAAAVQFNLTMKKAQTF